MKFGITSKLFVAILATNIVTAFAVGLGARYAFNNGFDSYLREREEARLTRLAHVLALGYEENQGWDFLRGNDGLWLQYNQSVRPSPGRRAFPHGPPLPERVASANGGSLPPPPDRGPGHEGRPDRPPPAVVLDVAGKPVVGPVAPTPDLRRQPIEISGRTVGWLATPAHHTVIDVVDLRFQEQQAWAGWAVALMATILSAIVAWLLARGVLLPVKRLASASRRLADGDYRTRVESRRNDELGVLVDDFNRLGNSLEKHESARRNFMADISHELRTPLAVLKGELEALEDGVRPLTKATLQSLQAEVNALNTLVRDLHDLSLADVGGVAYRFEKVDLARIVRECLQAFSERFAARGLAVEWQDAGPASVRGDDARLVQVVCNLLENIARYTHRGARVRLALQKEGNRTVLTIEDSGPGVSAELLPRLFERFYRVEGSRNREHGGSGLGLAICRSVVEAHGGSIDASASPLGGLRVVMRLPSCEERS
jgi:two-component system sensor histidine kinase BaeS